MTETSALLVLCTCPDQDTAENISRQLVNNNLAACVNLVPGIQSCFQWQGKVEYEPEVMLLIKSRAGRFDELRQAILDLHPYELPEIIAVPIDRGHQAYLDWITENTV